MFARLTFAHLMQRESPMSESGRTQAKRQHHPRREWVGTVHFHRDDDDDDDEEEEEEEEEEMKPNPSRFASEQ